jgi:isoquinoline 1-oxidoreductase
MKTDLLEDVFDDVEFDEVERYELREGPAYHFDTDRREFVQVLGAGLLIAVSSSAARAQQRGGGRGRGRGGARAERVSERFHIGEDGVVTVMTSKVEVGQGSRTQITQAAAEELRLPVEQIRVIMADTELCPDDGGTAGSRTTPSTVPAVRAAAASARELLLGLAADRLQADRASLAIQDGAFVDRTSNKRLTLADLAKDEGFLSELDAAPPANATIARVEEWKVLGTPVKKVGGEEVVTGAAQYPSDIRREGMLYGKVLRSPTLTGTLRSIDLGPAQQMEGVTVVRDGNFVGCAAKTSWEASQAVEAIAATAEWDSSAETPHPSSDELFAHFKATAREVGSGRRGGPTIWGDREAALAEAAKKIDVAYTIAYIQHAPMEPRAAVAEWTDGKLTVWAGTQQPSRVQRDLTEAFRLPNEKVRVIVPDTGGGFGGKHTTAAAIEAARLAKAAGKPVSVRWTREEEFTWAYCRPGGLIEVQAGLDSANKLHVWDFANYNSGGSAIDTPYEVPHGRTRTLATDFPLQQGSYRALASTANTFARECAMDELASLAKTDPLDFRLAYLPDGRLKDVLVASARKFDWPARRAKREANRGVGIACGTEKGSYVAACAEVAIEDDRIKVLSVCQAYECGAIQNPANLRAQVEGCIIMGLGGALTEEMRFAGGKVTTNNFSKYFVPRMDDVPELDIVLVDRRDLDSVGAGETPIIAVAPAIGNAVFQATGKRLRSIPMRL